jgi:hypothetical protein
MPHLHSGSCLAFSMQHMHQPGYSISHYFLLSTLLNTLLLGFFDGLVALATEGTIPSLTA